MEGYVDGWSWFGCASYLNGSDPRYFTLLYFQYLFEIQIKCSSTVRSKEFPQITHDVSRQQPFLCCTQNVTLQGKINPAHQSHQRNSKTLSVELRKTLKTNWHKHSELLALQRYHYEESFKKIKLDCKLVCKVLRKPIRLQTTFILIQSFNAIKLIKSSRAISSTDMSQPQFSLTVSNYEAQANTVMVFTLPQTLPSLARRLSDGRSRTRSSRNGASNTGHSTLECSAIDRRSIYLLKAMRKLP